MRSTTGWPLRWRLLAVIVGATAVALVLSGVSALLLVRRQATLTALDNVAAQTDDVADAVARLVAEVDRRQQRQQVQQRPRPVLGTDCGPIPLPCLTLLQLTNISNGAVLAISPGGTLQAGPGERTDGVDWDLSLLDVDALRAGGSQRGIARSPREGRIAYAARGLSVNGENLVVVAAIPVTPNVVGAGVLVLAGLVGLGVSAALSLWLADRFSRPLHEMTAAASALAAGDHDRRVTTPAEGEFGVLGRAFNRMADDLAAARAAQQQFLLSVSHDLRTPLTSIRGYAEAITDGAVSGNAAQKAASVIGTEADRLERLVRDLLDLARLDAAEFRLHIEPFQLADEMAELADAFTPRMVEAGISFSAAGPQLSITSDAERVGQIVGNLLENALRYVPTGRTVTLTWKAEDQGGLPGAALCVADTGNGIAPQDLSHVFERLYVASRYPGERPAGTGLGLAIVADLAAKLGGHAGVCSEPGRGTTFRVWLPLLSAP